MGKICTKCYKTKPKNLETCKIKNLIKVHTNRSEPSSPALVSRNLNPTDLNTINIVKEELVDKFDKSNDSEKDKENCFNWDNYFTKDQYNYYKKLYETESFDRPEPIIIKRIRKGELIGEGAFGKVFNAFDEDRGMLIAVKQIDLNKLRKKPDDLFESVKQEINLLANLNHKNIVKYYGIRKTDDQINILLEFCIGGSISKLLSMYKTFSENIIRKYTTQILEGLEYLHSHNIVHRDIKGANILVDRYGVCKLSDFGGAKIIIEEYDIKNNSFSGTPNWMSPESVRKFEYTRFSDIWSLGCTLIEMATGEPPWSEYKNPITVLYNILNLKSPPPIPKDLSVELKDFLSCCLKIEPTERLNVYQLLRHPFITGDIIVNNKQESSYKISCEINRFNSKGNIIYYSKNKQENIINENSDAYLKNFDSKGSEINNKRLNSEFAMKTHIYDSIRFNQNFFSKNGIRKESDDKDNIEGYNSNNSPIVLKFKDEVLNQNFDIDNAQNKISIHNSVPSYVNSRELNTVKIVNFGDQNKINFDCIRKYSKH